MVKIITEVPKIKIICVFTNVSDLYGEFSDTFYNQIIFYENPFYIFRTITIYV